MANASSPSPHLTPLQVLGPELRAQEVDHSGAHPGICCGEQELGAVWARAPGTSPKERLQWPWTPRTRNQRPEDQMTPTPV